MKKYLLLLLLIGCVGCTDSEISKLTTFGKPGKVTMYNGGKVVRQWTSTGRIETGKLIRVSGDIVVEQ